MWHIIFPTCGIYFQYVAYITNTWHIFSVCDVSYQHVAYISSMWRILQTRGIYFHYVTYITNTWHTFPVCGVYRQCMARITSYCRRYYISSSGAYFQWQYIDIIIFPVTLHILPVCDICFPARGVYCQHVVCTKIYVQYTRHASLVHLLQYLLLHCLTTIN